MGEKKDQKAANAQERALESSAETKKHNADSEDSQKEKEKTRSSGLETSIYFREKAERGQQFKTDELDVQKRELEIRQETTQNQQNQMFQYLQAHDNQMFLLLANIANSGGSKNS